MGREREGCQVFTYAPDPTDTSATVRLTGNTRGAIPKLVVGRANRVVALAHTRGQAPRTSCWTFVSARPSASPSPAEVA